MRKISMHKRVGSVLLCLSLLCGMVLGCFTLPAAAETVSETPAEASKFAADFSDLAKIAEDGGAFAETTYIRPGYATETDKAIKAWVDARFDMVSGYGKNMNRALLGQSSTSLSTSKDTWSGENYWNLMQAGYIQHKTGNSGQAYRLVEAFVPKFDGKQAVLANFEAKLTFSVVAPGSNPHGILVAFHEKTAAFTRGTGDHVFQEGTGSMVLLNNGAGSYTKAAGFGMFIYDQNNTYGKDGAPARAPLSAVVSNSKDGTSEGNFNYHANRNIDGEVFENNLVGNTKYDLIVRVVGTKVTATVKDMDGNVMYTKEKTLNQAGEGYISFGSSNAANRFYAIEVTELDEEGNAVDFGTKTGKDELETLKIDFADVPEIQYYDGKYYHNTRYDTADTAVGHDMNTDFLTAESTTHVINTKETILADYLESKFAFYYSQEGQSFERFNVNGYAVSDAGVEYTAKTGNVNAYAPDTKVSLGKYVDGIGYSGNSGNGIAKWYLDGNKYLAYTNNNKNGDGAFRKSASIAFKDKNGDLLQIDNFKLDLDFKMYADGTYDHSNIAVGFHANQPYMERGRTTQALFAISPYGGYFLGDDFNIKTGESYKIFNKTTGGYDDYTATADKVFTASHGITNAATSSKAMVWPYTADKIGNNALAHLTLTVVGNTATAKVTKGEEVILEKTVTLGTYYGSGYLFLSGANQQGWYGDIEVTRLDVNGNPVDFSDDNEGFDFGESFDAKATYYYKDSKFYRNTGKDMFWMEGGNVTYYLFNNPTTYADDAETVAHLKEKFDFWAYREGNEAKLSEPYQSTEDVLAADTYLKAASHLYYTTEGLAMYPETVGGGEALRKGFTIMPKIDGETIKARNVELVTDLVMTYDVNNYSLWNIDLRSLTEGKFITSAGNNKYATHVGVQVRPDGVNIVDGTAFPGKTADITAAAGYSAYNDGEKHYNVRVYAKVVNNKLTVKVTDSKTGATVYEVTDKVISYVEDGYVALSTGQAWATVSNLYVNVLEDNMTPAINANYRNFFGYNSLGNEDARIPAHLRTNKYPNKADYFGTAKNNYGPDHFALKNPTYAVADGYTLVTEGEGEEAVTKVMLGEEVVISTADFGVASIAYKDETNEVIAVTTDRAVTTQLIKDFDKEFYDYLNERFDAYYIDTAVYKGKGVEDNGWGTEATSVYVNEYLQFSGGAATVDKNADPVDQHISLLVPKANGQAVKGSEFTMKFRVRLSDAKTYGTAYIGFNMPKAGDFGKAAEQDGVIPFNSDIHAIKINKTQFQFWTGTEWVDLIPEGGYVGANHIADITLKVLDGKLTGSVHFHGASAQNFEVELTNTEAGYFAIGHNAGGVNFGALDLQVYDDFIKEEHVCDFATPKYDENGHWNECSCGEKDEVKAHEFENDCDTTCACGYTRTITHDYATAKYDENNHWNECACGEKADVAAHEFDNDCDTTCACGYVRDITHNYATTEYDDNGHWTKCACGETTEVVPHVFENDCDTDCACGYTRSIEHNYATPKFDENGHWNECNCGEKDEVIPHTMNGKFNEEGHWTACNCGYATALTGHTMENAYDFDGHWTACECGYATEKEYHSCKLVNNGDNHYEECACGYKTEAFDHDFTNGDCACGAEKPQAPNTAVADEETKIITVKVDEGYELRAGSLLVRDANGNYFVPTRVGFQDGGDASQYKIPDGAVAPYTVEAEFYQPTKEDLNIGLLGTQINPEESALRFVHRVNVIREGGKLYMNLDGKKVEVAEYGIILASGSLVKDPNKLTVEKADESAHIHKFVWSMNEDSEDRYFDVCSEYMDIAVKVKNIKTDKYDGTNTKIHNRLFVKLADGTIVYDAPVSSTYNETANGLA